MTEQKFLKELVKLVEQPGITADINKGCLRLYDGTDYGSRCPLSAVATAKIGQTYSTGQWQAAARDLGIDPKLKINIINAADDVLDTPTERLMRQKLLQACKLLT